MAPPPLALTMGEPAGIGGEIALAAWRRLAGQGPAFLALDDPERLRRIGVAPVRAIADPADATAVFPHALPVLPLAVSVSGTP
ncbi:MAG: 4-hydroxythreonine-4-phosphate dehydrogenase, partial [Geminicoccaceae bacterium]